MIEQQANLNLDEVVSIEDIGLQQTYDFVVPCNHNFIANDILVHNSGHIEANADAIIFIHRDNYYDRELQDNKAKMIIAKERQGGKVGFVPLYYDDRTSQYKELEETYEN
jgi:hypothetical protein